MKKIRLVGNAELEYFRENHRHLITLENCLENIPLTIKAVQASPSNYYSTHDTNVNSKAKEVKGKALEVI